MIRVYHSIVAAVAKSLPFLPPCSRASQQRYAFFPALPKCSNMICVVRFAST